jgi:hypothetical protein
MKYCAGILFFCLILVSCDRSAYEEIIFSGDEETRKHINENIFYGINPDPNHYIDNSEYNVEEFFREAEPEFGINHAYYFYASNDDIGIGFVNNILFGVNIFKNTNEHILGKYIGKNINEINNILGKLGKTDEVIRNNYMYWNINDNNDWIQIVTYTNGDIYYIGIWSGNGLEPPRLNVDE